MHLHMIFLISKSACILVELRSLVGDSLQMTSLAAICADFRETAAWLEQRLHTGLPSPGRTRSASPIVFLVLQTLIELDKMSSAAY